MSLKYLSNFKIIGYYPICTVIQATHIFISVIIRSAQLYNQLGLLSMLTGVNIV